MSHCWISKKKEQVDVMNKLGLQMTGRTCEELFKYGLKQSGTWPIDPDGDDYGYPAFDVYCDFESRSLTLACVDHMFTTYVANALL